MLSSHPAVEDLEEEEEWSDCSPFYDDDGGCFSGGPPPPLFRLPPPPCPPGLADDPWFASSCPAAAQSYEGTGRGGMFPAPGVKGGGESPPVSVAVVVVTAGTFVLLAVVAAIIVWRRGRFSFRGSDRGGSGSKAPPIGGAIIYDDLTPTDGPTSRSLVRGGRVPSSRPICGGRGGGPVFINNNNDNDPNNEDAPRPQRLLWTPIGLHSPPRYVQTPSLGRPPNGDRLHHHNEHQHLPHHQQQQRAPHLQQSRGGGVILEPLYQTISSGSGSGVSWRCPSSSSPSSPPRHLRRREDDDTDSEMEDEEEEGEDDSLTPFLPVVSPPTVVGTEDRGSSPLRSPCPNSARYYLSVPLDDARGGGVCGMPFRPPSASSSSARTSSHEYETLPLRATGGSGRTKSPQGRPLTPQERGLPPLPSRSERFRMFLPSSTVQEKGKKSPPSTSSMSSSSSSAGDKRCPPQIFRQENYNKFYPRKQLLPHAGDRPTAAPPSEVLYENVGLSSHL